MMQAPGGRYHPATNSANRFRIAPGLRRVVTIGAPLIAAGHALLAWNLVQDRLAGRGWQSDAPFALMLATLAGIVLLFTAALVFIWRMRIELRADGFELRGLFGTRSIPWSKVEGTRWRNGQMNAYLAHDELPLMLAHFERRELLYAAFRAQVPDLGAVERVREAREMRADMELGFTDQERRVRLAALRRRVRLVSWPGYAAAALGGANAIFFGRADVQLAAACVLAAVPPLLVLLALGHRNRIRIGPAEGSAYPDALPGILAASLALGLIAILDPHTLLGERFAQWTLPLTIALAGLWLLAERERLGARTRSVASALLLAAVAFLSAFWAGGGVYLINVGADDSAPAWGASRVTRLSTSTTKAGKLYHASVEPWSASPEPVELDVPRATYRALHVGARVEIGVRRGALGIPWVDEVRPAPAD
jgi:hypothetical protein